jgi:hypothetical protein
MRGPAGTRILNVICGEGPLNEAAFGMDRVKAVTLMEKRRQAWLHKDVDTHLSLFSEDFVYSDGVTECSGRASLAHTAIIFGLAPESIHARVPPSRSADLAS